MICPHCGEDTPPTETYCVRCGVAVDLDITKVQASLEAEMIAREERDTEAACRGYLLAAATALAVVVLARLLVVPPAGEVAGVPPYVAFADRAATAIEPLPIAPVEIEVPTATAR